MNNIQPITSKKCIDNILTIHLGELFLNGQIDFKVIPKEITQKIVDDLNILIRASEDELNSIKNFALKIESYLQ